ncbi:MAG: hypothetical protein J7M13_00235 [Synergistetes bacterium]|nr:hypothetical protein [Synergistota bacterium]
MEEALAVAKKVMEESVAQVYLDEGELRSRIERKIREGREILRVLMESGAIKEA